MTIGLLLLNQYRTTLHYTSLGRRGLSVLYGEKQKVRGGRWEKERGSLFPLPIVHCALIYF